MRKIGVALTALMLLFGSGAPVSAQTSAKDRARRHFAKGFAYYQNGDYLKAVKELKTAYAIRPVPVVLFYIGKTFQAAGLNQESARAFWQFLDEATLNNPKRAEALAALKQMGKPARAPASGIGPSGPGPQVTPREGPRVTPPPPRRRRPQVKPGEIIHEPLEDARPSHPMMLEAELPEDFGDWARLYLYYRPKGFEKFFKKPMKVDRRGIYHGCVPARHLKGTSIQYYIEAVGRTGKRKAGSGTASIPNIISLSPSAPLQPGGRLQGCPDEAAGPAGAGAGSQGPEGQGTKYVPPGGGTHKGAGSHHLKLIGFIAAAAVTVGALGAGIGLTMAARSRAQDMANMAVGGPSLVFDGNVEQIQKEGKAYDMGAAFCYVLAGLAAAGTGYLLYDVFLKGRSSKPEKSESEAGAFRLTPSIGPTTVGISGELRF